MQAKTWFCHGWHQPHTARAFQERGALAAFWMTDKNRTGISPEFFRRCWPFHIAMKPFYHLAPQILTEHAFYAFFPIWRQWFLAQPVPQANVVQAIMGFATEPFDAADRLGMLKVVDCPNSHPTTYRGYWQRECDLWCPGERVPIPQWMFSRMCRELKRADVILCPSTFVRDSMISNGIPEERCFINPFGVDTAIFQPRSVLPDRPRFVTTGTICLRKGHQYLLRAYEKLKKRIPEAELYVVGDFKTDFRLERIRWDGTYTQVSHLSHPELAALLQTCTAFVFPSNEEGFARVIPEAMASGLPIIATHESGATTMVEDGVEGFIVRSGDVDGICEAMFEAAINPGLNQKMGLAAHDKGAVKNTWQDYGDRLLTEYSKHLSNSAQTTSASR